MTCRTFPVLIVTGALVLFAVSCSSGGPAPASLVLRNAKVATVDEAFSLAEAIAVRADTIAAVGTNAAIEPFIGPETEVIDCAGKLVVPGLIDAHAHLRMYGMTLLDIDLRGVDTFAEVVRLVKERAADVRPGEWVLGNNWDQNLWDDVDDFPYHDTLSAAVPDVPVWLIRVDGHAGIANAKAMETAGVTRVVANPSGGEILRKPSGDPSGVFVDNAMGLIGRHVPDSTEERRREAITMASDRCLAVGITGIHDAGVSSRQIESYKSLIDSGELGIRIYAMLGNPGYDNQTAYETYLRDNMFDSYAGHRLSVRSIKLFMDGALGSRGAAMFEDYSDRSGYTGLLTFSGEDALMVSRAALSAGAQVCTHAIGDKGNRLILDAYEQALAEHPAPDHRFRVEHAQVVALEDIPRFHALGILPSMQPTHATSDMYWAEARVGPERVKGAYAWKRFLDTGCIIPCGSDFPVEKINPMLGFYAAVTRMNTEGWPEGGWYPDQCMTREEVLRGFTIWAAYAAFQEDILGSIEPGKLADMVVLSKDVLTAPPTDILTTSPEYTIVAGKIVYRR